MRPTWLGRSARRERLPNHGRTSQERAAAVPYTRRPRLTEGPGTHPPPGPPREPKRPPRPRPLSPLERQRFPLVLTAEGTSTALHFRSQGPRSHGPSSFPVPRFQHRAHLGSPGRASPARLTDQSGRSWIRRRGKPWVPRRRHTPSRRAPGARLPGLPRPPPAALRPPAAPGHAARSGTRFPSAYSPKVFARVR